MENVKKIISEIDNIYEMIQSNEINQSMEKLISLIENIQVNMEDISKSENFDINQFNSILGNMMNCMVQKDYYMLSDLLIYELKPILENIGE